MWGYWLATGEKEKATAEVIRFLRKRTKMQKRLVTYGFYFKNSSNRYVYNGNYLSFADEYNISEKLALYKANKRYWIECGCRHHMRAVGFTNDFSKKLYQYSREQWKNPVKEYDWKLECILETHPMGEIIKSAVAPF